MFANWRISLFRILEEYSYEDSSTANLELLNLTLICGSYLYRLIYSDNWVKEFEKRFSDLENCPTFKSNLILTLT